MSFNFLITALSVISIITGFVVEGVKKLLDNTKLKYSSNLLAVIVSVFITVFVAVAYILFNKIEFSSLTIIEIIGMALLSFLVSTIGYDKVIQMLKQLSSAKGNDNNDAEEQK